MDFLDTQTQGQENKEEPVHISIRLPTHAYFLSGIRDFTLSLSKNLTGFSEQWAYRCQAVVDELCNNAIEHGSKDKDEIKITFTSIQGKYLEFEVEDHGTGKERHSAEEMNSLVHTKVKESFITGFRGRGLAQIVVGWTDELEFFDVQPHGLRVRARKYLRQEENEAKSKMARKINTYQLTS